MSQHLEFDGWSVPEENWSKLPHDLVGLMPFMKESELKVTLYILRHTWGYSNFVDYQFMTVDEIRFGRKTKGGVRMDEGTGISKNSIISGIRAGIERGTLEEINDDSDKARQKKGYKLRGREQDLGFKIWTPEVQNLNPDLNKETYEERKTPQPLAEAANGSSKKQRKPGYRALFNTRMEAAFRDCSGVPLPKRNTLKARRSAGYRWNNPLWNIYELSRPEDERLGEKPLLYEEETLTITIHLIEAATAHMKANDLTVSAPASIEQVAISIHAKHDDISMGSDDFWERFT